MAQYRVRSGQTLPRHGKVHAAGTVLELEPDVAADAHVASRIEAVPDEPTPVVVVTKPAAETKVIKDAPPKVTAQQQQE